jgi:hypothetical protein
MSILFSRSKWMAIAVAIPLAAWGVGNVAAQQGGTAPGAAPSGMDHSGMDHGGMGHGGMGGMGQGGMGHGGMGGMGHGGMGHGGMGQGGMSQEGDAAATGGSGHEGHGMGGGKMMRHMMCRTSEHVDGRLAYLKAELKPTEAQTPQWNAFADAVRDSQRKLADFCAAMKKAHETETDQDKAKPHSVLDQLAMMEKNMTAHLDSVRTVRAAAGPLFAVLTEDQKKTAEEIMTGMMGFGMGMGKM